jgi:hypothetical protein
MTIERMNALAQRGACHRAALCADPLAPLPALRLLQNVPSKWIKSGLFNRGATAFVLTNMAMFVREILA